jgi:hypothetical protein
MPAAAEDQDGGDDQQDQRRPGDRRGAQARDQQAADQAAVRYETFTLPGDEEQSMAIYHADPGSPSEEALRLLANWGAKELPRWSAAA